VTAPQRRAGAAFLKGRGLSERRACQLVRLSRSSLHYEAVASQDRRLAERIGTLAVQHRHYGYRRIWALLRRDGERVNVKRVYRLWREAGLSQGRKRRKRRYKSRGVVPCQATHAHHVWTYDFVQDACLNGRKLKVLTVADEHTRYGLALAVRTRMGSRQVIEVLDRLFRQHGAPGWLRSDNGPEFVAKAVRRWLAAQGTGPMYIEPGCPWQNGYAESFNGHFREECLNAEAFANPAEAKIVVEQWRRYYNHERPHSRLGYLTPAEFRSGRTSVGALPPHPRSLALCAHQDEAQKKGGAWGSAHPSGMPLGARVALQRGPILRADVDQSIRKAV